MPLAISELESIALARIADARALITAKRFDGAAYLCGYAIEIALKARICHTLNWQGYPATKKEFEGYQSFKTHDLDVLLHLSGRESDIKTSYLAEWSAIGQWNPEARYQPIGSVAPDDAHNMVEAAEALVKIL